MGIWRNLARVLAAAALLTGCVASDVGPINEPSRSVGQASPRFIPVPGDDGSTVVGLAFSGGGTRAAAFAYGVLRELDDIVIDERPARRTLVGDIRMISGASGGSIAAAYFGYRGRDGYRDFRERFLVRDAEAYMRTSTTSPFNLIRAYNGGVNDRSSFARWLDRNLFDGATFDSLKWQNAPIVWINSSDINNRTPFLFTYDTFAALCSDLDRVRLADAVAASAAVPVVFAPVVVSAASSDCGYRRPAWLQRALDDRDASIRLQAYARALDSYQNAVGPDYIKLLDGGLTDNIGVTGFTLERAAAQTPFGPLAPDEAVRLDTLMFIVVDAGRDSDVDWNRSLHGPKLPGLIGAISSTGITASVRDEFDALRLAVAGWRSELIAYRCSLPAAAVREVRGTTSGWNCRDVELVVEHLSFDDLEPAERARVNQVATRLSLPTEDVDATIAAGRHVLRTNLKIQAAVARIRGRTGVEGPGRLAAAEACR